MKTDAETLALGGVAAEELARIYGTPLLVIDSDVLDDAIERFAAWSREFDLEVAYAAKAFLPVALARRLARSSLGLDVCSLGELLVAERAAFPRERITFHGCGKTDDELRAVCAHRVARIVVDHFEELERLARFAESGAAVPVVLRLNPGIEAETHRYVRTSGESSKFGFAIGEIEAAIARVLATPRLRLIGLHAHIGSNIFEPAAYLASLDVLFSAYARGRANGAPLELLILGGGFGVDAQPEGERLDVAGILRSVAARNAELAQAEGASPPRLGIEPGRALVAEAGTSLYRVVSVKRQGSRRVAIVDGSIADNPRPAIYGAYHHPLAAGRCFDRATEATTVCGRSCENDELAVAPLPTDLAAGDLLALRTTGAYTFSMASNYNRFPRPAVVFAGGGTHRTVVRRETNASLLENDVGDA